MTRSVTDLNAYRSKKTDQDLQIVVIDSFYDALEQNDAMSWLGELFRFKVNSYRAAYPYGILPFGGTDLFGAHWILCKKEKSLLSPLMGFETIGSKRTELFRSEFPALEVVAHPDHITHRRAIERELAKVHDTAFGLGYLGHWTISETARKDPFLSKFCRKASSALYAHWVQHFDVQAAVTFASMKFRVEEFHAYMGFARLTDDNAKQLEPFKAKPVFDDPVCISVLHRKNFSLASQKDAEDLKSLWDNRIVIGSNQSPLVQTGEKKKAA